MKKLTVSCSFGKAAKSWLHVAVFEGPAKQASSFSFLLILNEKVDRILLFWLHSPLFFFRCSKSTTRPRPIKSLCLKCLAMKQSCQLSNEKVDRVLLCLDALWASISHAHFDSIRMKKWAVSCCFGHLEHILNSFEWKNWPYLAVLDVSCTFWIVWLLKLHLYTKNYTHSTKLLAVSCCFERLVQILNSFKWKNWPYLAVLDVSCTFWILSNEKVGRILLFWTSRAHFEFFRMKSWPYLAVLDVSCTFWIVSIAKLRDITLK